MSHKIALSKILDSFQSVGDKSSSQENLGAATLYINSLHTWKETLNNEQSCLLDMAIEEASTSWLLAAIGLYRNSFYSLRLSIEQVLGHVLFSSSDITFREWRAGRHDITWATIVDQDNGVFSHRFAMAYFPEMSDTITRILPEVKEIYRFLSEYVHGNHHTRNTWPLIDFDQTALDEYCTKVNATRKIVNTTLCMRYLIEFDRDKTELLEQFILEDAHHCEAIRNHLTSQEKCHE